MQCVVRTVPRLRAKVFTATTEGQSRGGAKEPAVSERRNGVKDERREFEKECQTCFPS